MDVKAQIIDHLARVIHSLLGVEITPALSCPEQESHGDYASNVALVLFGRLKKQGNTSYKSPFELAEAIANEFKVQSLKFKVIDRVDVVSPGFINFWISAHELSRSANEMLGNQEETVMTRKSSQTVMLEFADPNPFKQFHIGHLRNITLGESFARLLEATGDTVWRVNYQGDVGMHVAKALFGMVKKTEGLGELEKKTLGEKLRFLGEAYALGAKAYEEDEAAKAEIQKINKQVYNLDPEIMPLWKKGRAWSMEGFEEMYKRAGTTYKRYYPESEVAQVGKELVLAHIEDGIFERDQGAVVFKGEKYGLHTRVFVTKESYATYEGKDMALAKVKYDDVPYDRSIIITANEQSTYFTVILKALSLVYPDLGKKTEHHAFGFVTLADGKMSSRKGNVITGEWLLDEAKKRIKAIFPDMDEQTLESVAVGAVKYSMLRFGRESDISFNFQDSITLEGNSGPYIQYTYARTQSVLAKVKSPRQHRDPEWKLPSGQKAEVKTDGRFEIEEALLLRQLYHFPEVVAEAATQFAPHLLCNYVFGLSQSFNLFYQKHKVVGSDNESFRLALTAAVGAVLKKSLYLLGIQAPQKM